MGVARKILEGVLRVGDVFPLIIVAKVQVFCILHVKAYNFFSETYFGGGGV